MGTSGGKEKRAEREAAPRAPPTASPPPAAVDPPAVEPPAVEPPPEPAAPPEIFPSAEQVAFVAKVWGINIDPECAITRLPCYGSIRDTGIGPVVLTEKLDDGAAEGDKPRRFVLKPHGKASQLAKREYQNAVQVALLEGGLPVPQLYTPVSVTEGSPASQRARPHIGPQAKRRTLGEFDEQIWTLAEFKTGGRRVKREEASAAECEGLGFVAAKMQAALAHAEPPINKRVAHVHTWKSRATVLSDLRKDPEAQEVLRKDTRLASIFDTCLERLSQLERSGKLNECIAIHNDLGFINVEFEEGDSSDVALLVDFDLVQSDFRTSEFNNMVWADIGFHPLKFDPAAFDAILRGYERGLVASKQSPLCTEEREHVFEVVRSRVLENVLRHAIKQYPAPALESPQFASNGEANLVALDAVQARFPFPQTG